MTIYTAPDFVNLTLQVLSTLVLVFIIFAIFKYLKKH